MKFVPRNLNKLHRGQHILEHAMLFVVAFITPYALSIFGPMLLSGRRGGSKTGGELFIWVASNQTAVFIACFIIAIVASLAIYTRNKSKAQLTGLEFDDKAKKVKISYKPYYRKRIDSCEVAYDTLVFSVKVRSQQFLGYKYTIVQFSAENKPICSLDSSSALWDKESKNIHAIIGKLRSI